MERPCTEYPYAARSKAAFVSQVVRYITSGYRYYVTGTVPGRIKDPRKLDRKLVEKYQVEIPKWTRARRKKLGYANLRYLRYRNFWVLFATDGRHEFKIAERKNLRDIWNVPLKFRGYSISMKDPLEGRIDLPIGIKSTTVNGIILPLNPLIVFLGKGTCKNR